MPIDFRLRDHVAPLSMWRLHRTLDRLQWASPDERRRYRETRLRAVLSHARRNVPYYRETLDAADIRSPVDLGSLPRLSKETVRERFADLTSIDAARRGAVEVRTSGTTGAPLRFLLDRDARGLEFCYYWRHWSWAGYRLGDRFCELGTVHFLGRGVDRTVDWQPHLRRLMIHAGRVSAAEAPAIAAEIERRRPRFLKGMPSSLLHLARSLEEAGRGGYSFRAVFSTGERLGAGGRCEIERVFGAPVLDSYGHMERTVAVSQCLQGSYHVHDDYGALELVDATQEGDALVGRALGTSLHNLSMPLIRYEVGDLIEPAHPDDVCPCGRTLPLVKRIHGRDGVSVLTPDGRALSAPFILFDLVDGVLAGQVVQPSASALEWRVVPTPQFDAGEEDKLLHLATELAGPRVAVRTVRCRWEDLERGASGKPRPVIALHDGAGAR